MDCPPIPQFCLDFLLRSKTYSKECPPSVSIANRDFHSLASISTWWDWFTHTTRCKLCCYTVVYTCLAHDVTHYLHRFERLVVHNINSGPSLLFEPKVRYSTHGSFFTRLRYMQQEYNNNIYVLSVELEVNDVTRKLNFGMYVLCLCLGLDIIWLKGQIRDAEPWMHTAAHDI